MDDNLKSAISNADESAYQLLKQLNEIKNLSGSDLTGGLINQIVDADIDLIQRVMTSLNRLNITVKDK